ncbi:hypothetical protein NQ317_010387 [Molorchus minor]|uniref:Uncharacterized protein n=1 Tax=Molorchus minor TaxID=1323400 RepID=A0ABQ9IRP1_9CUCU|nr:hypothetical protein NQ317_010387 [Molorchus minor]
MDSHLPCLFRHVRPAPPSTFNVTDIQSSGCPPQAVLSMHLKWVSVVLHFFASLATVVAVVGAYLFQKKRKEILPWTWEEIGTLKKLNLYPLKSGHRLELDKAECTDVGLRQTEEDEKIYQLRDRLVKQIIITVIICREQPSNGDVQLIFIFCVIKVHDSKHIGEIIIFSTKYADTLGRHFSQDGLCGFASAMQSPGS